MSTHRILLEPAIPVWLGYGEEVGGFEGTAGEMSEPVRGWPVVLVGFPRSPSTSAWVIGDKVEIVIEMKTHLGVVESFEDDECEYPINVEILVAS